MCNCFFFQKTILLNILVFHGALTITEMRLKEWCPRQEAPRRWSQDLVQPSTPTPRNHPAWLMGHNTPIKNGLLGVQSPKMAQPQSWEDQKIKQMLISSFGWNSDTTGGIWGWAQRALLNGNEAVQLTVSESLLGGRNGHEEKYVQQQTRTQMAVPGRVWGPSSDPVEIKELSSDIFMTQPVLDWPWAFPKNDLPKGFSSTPLAPVRSQTQQCLNLLDPFLNL